MATAAPKRLALATSAVGAFFDVDETIIDTKTMFDFLRYHLVQEGDDGERYQAKQAEMQQLAQAGTSRGDINRCYYRQYAGVPLDRLMAEGRAWYSELRGRPNIFLAPSLDELRHHQRVGSFVVLVSGSFRACLEPIAADLNVDLVLCTEPIVDRDGSLTGEVRLPMIGQAKAQAVIEVMNARGMIAAQCYGYGDHATDLDLLQAVGHPSVVGTDPVLNRAARELGWPLLSATTGPGPIAKANSRKS